ncbi:unnamed protein product [Debaryomyces fabryi]|nr:unnamed protein product [Debaryomyces fabryi]
MISDDYPIFPASKTSNVDSEVKPALYYCSVYLFTIYLYIAMLSTSETISTSHTCSNRMIITGPNIKGVPSSKGLLSLPVTISCTTYLQCTKYVITVLGIHNTS